MIDPTHIDMPIGAQSAQASIASCIDTVIQDVIENVLDRAACDRANDARRAVRAGVAQTRIHPNAIGRGFDRHAEGDGFDFI